MRDNTFAGLTVGELIEILSNYDENMLVAVAAASGDYWKRTIANPVTEEGIEESIVEWSNYHDTWKVAEEYTDDGVEVLVIGKAAW